MPSKDPFSTPPSRESQLTREDIADMHWTEVNAALKAGRLDEAMRTPNPENDKGYRGNANRRVGNGVQGRDFQAIVEAGRDAGR